jgi:hypothetical protein
MSEKESNSMMKKIFKEIKHCDKLMIDTKETNVTILHEKFSTTYSKFQHLIIEKKIVIYDSDK